MVALSSVNIAVGLAYIVTLTGACNNNLFIINHIDQSQYDLNVLYIDIYRQLLAYGHPYIKRI